MSVNLWKNSAIKLIMDDWLHQCKIILIVYYQSYLLFTSELSTNFPKATNTKYLGFPSYAEAIIYLLLHNLHDSAFN